MRIIPAIDIIDGKCVRLTKGDYSTKKIYNENPIEVAKQFEGAGIEYLHLVDLDGAKAKHIVNYRVLEQITSKTSLKVDFGGGLKSNEDLHIAFNSGAKQVTGGSIAVTNTELFESWIVNYGSSRIILGADCNNYKVAVNGWQKSSQLEVLPFIKDYQKKGIRYVICTDIAKDGMLQGPSYDLYNDIIQNCSSSNGQSVKLIASGGVTSLDDLNRLERLGCEAVIIGKAIYEGHIQLRDLEKQY
ncbi:1-(5-phosphoribosyl)-5-[(5-phosphoribosylamino)methylideneamino]imidazole-4-carboxamide isomerase [Hanstruepera flava]|uniref:1-(5-phosphoribosyl)-5-[(5- phosphoribosylamino)methylideneamino]imidazole-4- carboxamide isomerase n=1 Tax=Hanstruepera flava TaxID=2930218 RepID=UPI002028D874|nr:1-(5-phosphoribosyl)-5-[(5-phosphoribosylamino)methylideneamino]imidazole-4-carboxamide isomerase [Hanstruepera flava]